MRFMIWGISIVNNQNLTIYLKFSKQGFCFIAINGKDTLTGIRMFLEMFSLPTLDAKYKVTKYK